ncbi:serine-threonine protein kinase [Streptomyces sp. PKU-EA00015]|uniref:serine-threonine protein kinase n=1 Tax=Streptomyces sp. PKU-EA00015 TaxID=2748326 RepID=UPI0015A19AB5|nr:serine-threonine protein kinase [Streptomyces sp. PKU-EA00015]NWF28577.1 serine-threonine protein kinase [Streptomyces sp. PKU-EA00015]
MSGTGVRPYREITFDADGDVLGPYGALMEQDVTDLVMFAHGWNNSPGTARRLYASFFAPFPKLVAQTPQARLGYAGVVWPSMRFSDEPIPDVEPPAAGAQPSGPGLDGATRAVLAELFPGHRETVERLARLLDEQPESRAAFAEFGRLARELAATPPGGMEAGFAEDLPHDEQSPPAVLYEDTLTLCRRLAAALEAESGSLYGALPFGGGLRCAWRGAKELLRQTTYYAMKRRAGTVGELGLGPLLGLLARSAPRLRVHLVGHSQGARLVAFALRGLPEGADNVKSVTLLQGALSHYAFACGLPHAPHSAGALAAVQERVDGPVVACYSRHDSALGVFYPLASALAGDSASAAGGDRRWWAMGHDGIQAVAGTSRLTLEEALRDGLPDSGCVSVDAAQVVRRGGPPAGAHSDICHEELARVVLSAGRVGR